MKIITLSDVRAPSTREVLDWLKKREIKGTKPGGGIWQLRNEIRPCDLYLYLYARFGAPNGIQNILRADDSDNLIHWEWALEHPHGMMFVQGHNLRTEVQLLGNGWDFGLLDKDQLVRWIKNDFGNYGPKMSKLRKEMLEHWETFVNPYHQLRSSVDTLREKFEAIDIDPNEDAFPDASTYTDFFEIKERMARLGRNYEDAFQLALSLRILAPILAESFVNMTLFCLMKPEIRNNERLYRDTFRRDIDVRVQTLHLHCAGFSRHVDWSSPECQEYNKVIADRNDLLHGNIAMSKLKTGEVYFNGKVPVFKEYRGMWEQSLLRGLEISGYQSVRPALDAVDGFISYVLSCLSPLVRKEQEYVLSRRELGHNLVTGRLGVLFPDHIVDSQMQHFSQEGPAV